MADFTIEVDLKGMRKRLDALAQPKLTKAMLSVVRLTVQTWLRSTVLKISGPYLGVVTGTARRSMTAKVERDGDTITGRFGSPLRYVRAHELGFDGTVFVKPFERQPHLRTRQPRDVLERAAVAVGTKLRRRRVSYAYVRGHNRHIVMRARRFMRDSITEDLSATNDRIRRALIVLARTGEAPTVGELL